MLDFPTVHFANSSFYQQFISLTVSLCVFCVEKLVKIIHELLVKWLSGK